MGPYSSKVVEKQIPEIIEGGRHDWGRISMRDSDRPRIRAFPSQCHELQHQIPSVDGMEGREALSFRDLQLLLHTLEKVE